MLSTSRQSRATPDRYGLHRLRSDLQADTARYVELLAEDGVAGGRAATGLAGVLRAVVLSPGLQATAIYRVGHAVAGWQPTTPPALAARAAARVAAVALTRVCEVTHGIWLSEHATIGPGLHLGHPRGTVIGAVRLGSNVNISQHVTLGRSSRRGDQRLPVLGDRVWVGPGAVVTGGLRVGDDVVIGANAVVTRDLPDRAVALGVPAKVARHTGSFAQVVYRGMDTDPARLASLGLVRTSA